MNRFFIPIFCFLQLSVAGMFSACNSEEPMEDTISGTIVDDYQEVTFEISQNVNLETRCIPTSSTSNQNILSESCLTHESRLQNLVVMLSYDNSLLAKDTILNNGELVDLSANPYIINLKKNTDKDVSISYRFIKILDPSKIEITCVSTNYPIGRNGFPDINDIENGLDKGSIAYKYNCEHCVFFKIHHLTGYNNWSDIDTRIELKRISSEILILSETNNYDSKGVTWMSDFLNFRTDVNHLSQLAPGTVSLGFGLCDFASQRFYFNDSPTMISETGQVIWNRLSIGKEFSFASQQFSNFKENRVKYNNKDYYFFTPLSVFATEKASYPVTSTGEQYKYVTLIGFTDRNIPYNVYWTNIPLPNGGLQANKRYIYILGSSFKFWDNGPVNKTRSANDGTVNYDDFKIIEMDMDDPIPFE
ncbi:MAG: hypothetical protein J1E95_01590 [Muribaculaceae bacterium]|nr:hypothetical protein [Muribaculaceae bacterium]